MRHFRSRNLGRRSWVHCPKHHNILDFLRLLGRILRRVRRPLGRLQRQLGNLLQLDLALRFQRLLLMLPAYYLDRRMGQRLQHRKTIQDC